MGNVFFFEWESDLMVWLQGFSGSFLTAAASAVTYLGNELLLVALIGFFYWCYDKEAGRFIGINVLCGLVLGPLVKNIALRRRPYMDVPGVRCLCPVSTEGDIYDVAVQGFSFPSMHASNTMMAYTSVAMCLKKRVFRHLAASVILLVGVSRVYLGVHFPTDVLAGWALGALVTAAVSCAQRKGAGPLPLLAVFGIIALPGWFFCKSTDFYTTYGLLCGALFGFAIEEKYVRFAVPAGIWRKLLRLAGGLALFLVLEKGLKLPFPRALLEGTSFLSFFIRCMRYFISSLGVIGFYPMLFKKEKEQIG